jgi:hypothetical protein
VEPILKEALLDSTELWLIQMPLTQVCFFCPLHYIIAVVFFVSFSFHNSCSTFTCWSLGILTMQDCMYTMDPEDEFKLFLSIFVMDLSQFEPADFAGKQLSLKLTKDDGWMGCSENSHGKMWL